jgi:hypothetical protein
VVQIVEIVEKFHRDNPQSPGITPKELFETSHLKKEVFDGNIQSLVLDFAYTDFQARAISVNCQAIVEALRKVYDAAELTDKIVGRKRT